MIKTFLQNQLDFILFFSRSKWLDLAITGMALQINDWTSEEKCNTCSRRLRISLCEIYKIIWIISNFACCSSK